MHAHISPALYKNRMVAGAIGTSGAALTKRCIRTARYYIHMTYTQPSVPAAMLTVGSKRGKSFRENINRSTLVSLAVCSYACCPISHSRHEEQWSRCKTTMSPEDNYIPPRPLPCICDNPKPQALQTAQPCFRGSQFNRWTPNARDDQSHPWPTTVNLLYSKQWIEYIISACLCACLIFYTLPNHTYLADTNGSNM